MATRVVIETLADGTCISKPSSLPYTQPHLSFNYCLPPESAFHHHVIQGLAHLRGDLQLLLCSAQCERCGDVSCRKSKRPVRPVRPYQTRGFLDRDPDMFERSVSHVIALQAVDIFTQTVIDYYGKFVDEEPDVISVLSASTAFTESEQYSICSSVDGVNPPFDASAAVDRC